MISAGAAGLKVLPGHVPAVTHRLVSIGQLPATNQVRLAIGVPLRDEAGLNAFLEEVYDPASTNYQHYLTPEIFADRFGPTTADYELVMAFARTNGLKITATHGNRLLLDVMGSAADVNRAFHVNLLTYQHPTESREFYAPDTEPTVAAGIPMVDVSGLESYSRPHPHFKVRANNAVSRGTGSGSSGAYFGNDFRAAYLPGVTLTGAGQMVGLVQFDGYYASDISAYAQAAGISAVPVQTVLLDGYDGTPTTGAGSGNGEVSLDIEMAMAMAPGLAKIMVFEGGPSGIPNDILSAMASSNQVKQLSCSWGWSGGPTTTTDTIFKQMAAQGQSFFNASGDGDAFTTGSSSYNGVDNTSLANTPSSCPYITQVGGTTLTTTGPGGSWSSETVWNWGVTSSGYEGSSGGISSYYTIPTWQTNINMTTNGGSTTYRNIPDVAFTADNVEVIYGSGTTGTFGGTSCAAPLWAGLTALINQQAVSAGKTNVGFLNPALYALAKTNVYTVSFHDITTGNNVTTSSPSLFYAKPGYDLCTGWGTPSGQALINVLSGVTNWLGLLTSSGFASAGPVGGPFSVTNQIVTLTNVGATALTWSLINTSVWLTASVTNGTLASGTTTNVMVTLGSAAANLTPAVYTNTLVFTNDGVGALSLTYTLTVGQSVVQNGGFEAGSFTGWTLVGDTTSGSTIYNAVESLSSGFSVVHSGTYGAFLGDTQLASLSQTITTVPGQYYWLSLWAENSTSGTGQRFVVNWNTNSTATNTLLSLLNPPVFAWTNFQFLALATSTNTILQIRAENDPNYFGLDDISVTPVPAPGFKTLVRQTNNLQLGWVTATGLVYQVQYKTNLVQTSWTALNTAFTATNYSVTVLDTNAVKNSPQRFYRLVVKPAP